MIDVTNISNLNIGDEVVLMGNSENNTISADEIAHRIRTIGYEFICNISSNSFPSIVSL